MHEKKGFSKRAEEFLSGKGFYIVLFVCVAVIGVSAWLLLFSEFSPLNPGDEGDYLDVMADVDDTAAPIDLRDEEDAGNIGDTDDAAPPVTDNTGTESGGNTQNNTQSGTQEGTGAHTIEDEPQSQTSEEPLQTEDPEDTGETEDKPTAELQPGDINFIWPLNGSVSMEHSPDALVFDKTMGDWRTHDGVDVAAQIGTKVMAVADGTVVDVYEDDMFGTTVVIDHGAGVKSYCSNLAAVPTVKEGDGVIMGAVIGSVGDTALAETGDVAHLHFAITVDGKSADPLDYLPAK